jgi:mannose-1-phosphate guanylyltransferase/mannose-6-phosphate isomerase
VNIVPVILCGGSGTRLWPASRDHHPKQFLNLLGDLSLLQTTALRALRVTDAPAKNLVAVTLKSLRPEVERQLREIDSFAANHIVPEPMARNTAAAVALAADYVEKNFGRNSIMWILPSDHHVGSEDRLKQAFTHAINAANAGKLVTFGIKPTRPETGYGYINIGKKSKCGTYHMTKAFVEKPDLDTAQTYLDTGNYLWNSGMFVFNTGILLDQYAEFAPAILDNVRKSQYAAIKDEPFDKAIMEKSPHVAVVPCDPMWSDIGSWESLWEISDKDKNGNMLDGYIAAHDVHNSYIKGNGRLIACAGVENLVIIETEDAILIADKRNGDSMRAMVMALKKAGFPEVGAIQEKARVISLSEVRRKAS